MKHAIITDIPLRGKIAQPIVKGEILYEDAGLIILRVMANATNYPGSEFIRGVQKFNKEFYDSEFLEV